MDDKEYALSLLAILIQDLEIKAKELDPWTNDTDLNGNASKNALYSLGELDAVDGILGRLRSIRFKVKHRGE